MKKLVNLNKDKTSGNVNGKVNKKKKQNKKGFNYTDWKKKVGMHSLDDTLDDVG